MCGITYWSRSVNHVLEKNTSPWSSFHTLPSTPHQYSSFLPLPSRWFSFKISCQVSAQCIVWYYCYQHLKTKLVSTPTQCIHHRHLRCLALIVFIVARCRCCSTQLPLVAPYVVVVGIFFVPLLLFSLTQLSLLLPLPLLLHHLVVQSHEGSSLVAREQL